MVAPGWLLQGSTLYEGSVGNFYSPLQSPLDSGDEEEEEEELVVAGVRVPRKFIRRKNKVLTGQEREFIKTGEEVLATALGSSTVETGDWRDRGITGTWSRSDSVTARA